VTAVTIPAIRAGERVEENRSRFMACGGPCGSTADAVSLVAEMTGLFRLAKASQSSWAARFRTPGGAVREEHDDGGESGAARCILEVMQAMDAVDCLVLVARWYGGRHLGGMRFRIYRTLTGRLLASAGAPAGPAGPGRSR
jgi:putative IMPACT (imprinted ancient) family translation regulator